MTPRPPQRWPSPHSRRRLLHLRPDDRGGPDGGRQPAEGHRGAGGSRHRLQRQRQLRRRAGRQRTRPEPAGRGHRSGAVRQVRANADGRRPRWCRRHRRRFDRDLRHRQPDRDRHRRGRTARGRRRSHHLRATSPQRTGLRTGVLRTHPAGRNPRRCTPGTDRLRGIAYIRPQLSWSPSFPNTTHEGGFRPGTVNVPGITAMTIAAKKIHEQIDKNQLQYSNQRNILIDHLRPIHEKLKVHGLLKIISYQIL